MSNAPIVSVTATDVTYRASALGGCLRKLYYARYGYAQKDPPENLQKAFNQGHLMEKGILKLTEQAGWVLTDHQKEVSIHIGQAPNSDKDIHLVGHIDALGKDPDNHELYVVDAKAFTQSTFDKLRSEGLAAFPHYSWQQSAYCYGTGLPRFCLPIYNKDTKELRIQTYESPSHRLSEIVARIMYVEDCVANNMPPPCDESFPCPFFYLHDQKEQDELNDEQVKLASDYLSTKLLEETIATRRKNLGKRLLESLEYDDKLRSFYDFNGEVTVRVVNNPKRLDMNSLKELLREAEVNIDDYYTPGNGVSIRVEKKKKD